MLFVLGKIVDKFFERIIILISAAFAIRCENERYAKFVFKKLVHWKLIEFILVRTDRQTSRKAKFEGKHFNWNEIKWFFQVKPKDICNSVPVIFNNKQSIKKTNYTFKDRNKKLELKRANHKSFATHTACHSESSRHQKGFHPIKHLAPHNKRGAPHTQELRCIIVFNFFVFIVGLLLARNEYFIEMFNRCYASDVYQQRC